MINRLAIASMNTSNPKLLLLLAVVSVVKDVDVPKSCKSIILVPETNLNGEMLETLDLYLPDLSHKTGKFGICRF